MEPLGVAALMMVVSLVGAHSTMTHTDYVQMVWLTRVVRRAVAGLAGVVRVVWTRPPRVASLAARRARMVSLLGVKQGRAVCPVLVQRPGRGRARCGSTAP